MKDTPGRPVATAPEAGRTEPFKFRAKRGRPTLDLSKLSLTNLNLSKLDEHRYFVLSGLLLLLVASYLLKGRWPGGIDLWEHSAAAREFAEHPFNPRHPLLSVDAAHQFQNPYLLAVGLLARLTEVSVVTAMNVAAVFNVVLLLVGLRLFVRRIVPHPHVDSYALIFILFLWGPGAWFFSGFLHFNVFALVLAYPSTFAKGLAILGLWAFTRYLDTGKPIRLLAPFLIAATLWVTHPVDGIFYAIGVVALAWVLPSKWRTSQALVLTGGLLGLSFLLALCWPYFSLYELVLGDAVEPYRKAISAEDRDMYRHILTRLGPSLLVIPFVVRRWKLWRSDVLVLLFLGTLAAYYYGYATNNWSYGRLISAVQVVGSIILAEEIVLALRGARASGAAGAPAVRWIQATTAGMALLGMFYVRNGFEMLPEAWVADRPYHWIHHEVEMKKISDFSFMEQNHKKYPVVMADIYTSMELPTFGPKVVAYARTQAFASTEQRGPDIGKFYDRNTSAADRQAILQKYDVSLLVVTQERLAADPTVYRPFLDLGKVVSQNTRFVFIEVAPARA